MNNPKPSRILTRWQIACVLLLAFSTLSVPIQKKPWFQIDGWTSWELDPRNFGNDLQAGENDWGFVKQSAEWARGNSTFIDNLMASIRDNPILQQTGTYENVALGNSRFRIIIQWNTTQPNIASGAYPGTKTFQHKLEIRRQSENDLALQLFFDSVTQLNDNGALMYYNLAKLNPSANFFDNSQAAIVETYLFRKPDGFKRQVYTWKNAPRTQTAISDSGRVILDEVLGRSSLCFRSVARVAGNVMQNSMEQNLSGAVVDAIYSACGTTKGSDLYYSLAYMQNFSFPYLTTAKYGWSGNSERKEGFCGVANTNNNYGLFDDRGFVRDGVSAAQVPSGYPSPDRGEMSVDIAFQATFTAETGLSYGVSGSDDTSRAFIDGINSNSKIAFK